MYNVICIYTHTWQNPSNEFFSTNSIFLLLEKNLVIIIVKASHNKITWDFVWKAL